VQEHESQLFLSYFKKGITYLEGGVESGFRHVERDQYETRLLHLKGKRNVRVKPVPVTRASLNSGDVFVLDAGLKIYVFNGKDANRMEKVKGLDVAARIRDDERGGRAQLLTVDEGEQGTIPKWIEVLVALLCSGSAQSLWCCDESPVVSCRVGGQRVLGGVGR
jgi:hypothetical protein